MNVYKNPAVDTNAKDFVIIKPDEKQNTVHYGDILFTGSSETPEECGISSVMVIQPEEPFYLNSFTIGFRLNDPTLLNPEFTKHLFRSAELRKQINKTANGVTRFNVSKVKLSAVVIPIPPLPVQQEIVRILDTFNNVVAELEAELAARVTQYEHCRNELLSFDSKSKINERLLAILSMGRVEYEKLGEVAEIRSGWGFPLSEQGKLTRELPFFKVSDMNTPGNEIIMQEANNYIDNLTATKLGCNPAPAGTIIFPKIGAAIGTNKKRILAKTSCYDNNVVGIVPSEKVLSRYVFFLFESIDLLNFADYSGAMPSIRKTTLEKYVIPLPPKTVQAEIVRMLDTFTYLVNDLNSGLPAEIALRRKQYEYYRDKLLTFKEKPA